VPLLKQEDWAKTALIVTLTSKDDAKATATRRIEGPQAANDFRFETRDMPWGAYELKAVVQGPDGKDLAAASTTARMPTMRSVVIGAPPLRRLGSSSRFSA
jgi:hypothetical protein